MHARVKLSSLIRRRTRFLESGEALLQAVQALAKVLVHILGLLHLRLQFINIVDRGLHPLKMLVPLHFVICLLG